MKQSGPEIHFHLRVLLSRFARLLCDLSFVSHCKHVITIFIPTVGEVLTLHPTAPELFLLRYVLVFIFFLNKILVS